MSEHGLTLNSKAASFLRFPKSLINKTLPHHLRQKAYPLVPVYSSTPATSATLPQLAIAHQPSLAPPSTLVPTTNPAQTAPDEGPDRPFSTRPPTSNKKETK